MMARAVSNQWGYDLGAQLDLDALTAYEPRIPRVRFTHGHLDESVHWDKIGIDPREYHARPVVLLARDPRDVVVSSFYQQVFRVGRFSGTIEEFVRMESGSFLTLLHFYREWSEARVSGFQWSLVRYEDLRENPIPTLRGVLEAVGMTGFSAEALEEAVRFARFENMRRIELDGSLDGRLRPRDVKDERTFKTRKGAIGGYRDELSAGTIEWMESRMEAVLPKEFGYAPSRQA